MSEDQPIVCDHEWKVIELNRLTERHEIERHEGSDCKYRNRWLRGIGCLKCHSITVDSVFARDITLEYVWTP